MYYDFFDDMVTYTTVTTHAMLSTGEEKYGRNSSEFKELNWMVDEFNAMVQLDKYGG